MLSREDSLPGEALEAAGTASVSDTGGGGSEAGEGGVWETVSWHLNSHVDPELEALEGWGDHEQLGAGGSPGGPVGTGHASGGNVFLMAVGGEMLSTQQGPANFAVTYPLGAMGATPTAAHQPHRLLNAEELLRLREHSAKKKAHGGSHLVSTGTAHTHHTLSPKETSHAASHSAASAAPTSSMGAHTLISKSEVEKRLIRLRETQEKQRKKAAAEAEETARNTGNATATMAERAVSHASAPKEPTPEKKNERKQKRQEKVGTEGQQHQRQQHQRAQSYNSPLRRENVPHHHYHDNRPQSYQGSTGSSSAHPLAVPITLMLGHDAQHAMMPTFPTPHPSPAAALYTPASGGGGGLADVMASAQQRPGWWAYYAAQQQQQYTAFMQSALYPATPPAVPPGFSTSASALHSYTHQQAPGATWFPVTSGPTPHAGGHNSVAYCQQVYEQQWQKALATSQGGAATTAAEGAGLPFILDVSAAEETNVQLEISGHSSRTRMPNSSTRAAQHSQKAANSHSNHHTYSNSNTNHNSSITVSYRSVNKSSHDNTPQDQKYQQTDPFSMYRHNKKMAGTAADLKN